MSNQQVEALISLNEQILEHRGDIQECMAFDRQFHTIACCSNKLNYIRPFLDSVWDKSNPYKALYYTTPEAIDETYRQHKQIIDSFVMKDADMLTKAIDNHLRDVVDVVSRNPLFSYAK